MNEAKEKTALCTSVGADERQSVQNTISSISALDTEINHPDENSPENFEDILRQMQRMSDPAYLHTVSMNELYETVYQSRPPVIDGLLYSGTYLFAGAPKVGKSFFMAQLAYHISTGQPLWNYEVHQGTVLYLALEDDYQRLQERMSRMFGVEGTDNLHFAVYAETELWKKPPDPLLEKIAAVITEDSPVWSGSATELVALLGEDIQPNILTRRLNVKAGDLLNEYGIEYAMKRTRTGSAISLTRISV